MSMMPKRVVKETPDVLEPCCAADDDADESETASLLVVLRRWKRAWPDRLKEMTSRDVVEMVSELRRAAELTGDDEKCHAAEDTLLYLVLRAIAAGASKPELLAELAAEIDAKPRGWSRWYS